MRWPLSAVKLLLLGACCLAHAQKGHMLRLVDGTTLNIPQVFFHDVDVVLETAKKVLVRGRLESSRTGFLFVSLARDEHWDPLKDFLKFLDMDLAKADRIGDVPGKGSVPLYRIEGNGAGRDYVFTYGRHSYRQRNTFFYLFGPEPEFFQAVPGFWDMAKRVEWDPSISANKEKIALWMVLSSILLLGINVLVIWLGFREIARQKKAAEE